MAAAISRIETVPVFIRPESQITVISPNLVNGFLMNEAMNIAKKVVINRTS